MDSWWADGFMWLASGSIACASIGMFWDVYARVAGLLQVPCSVEGRCVTMFWHGSVSRVRFLDSHFMG